MGKKQKKAIARITPVSMLINQSRIDNSNDLITEDETLARKKKLLNALDIATDKFVQNLSNGDVNLNGSVDLERLVKLTLLLNGEAESIQDTRTQLNAEILKLNTVPELSRDDPNVQALMDSLYKEMNEHNDREEESVE